MNENDENEIKKKKRDNFAQLHEDAKLKADNRQHIVLIYLVIVEF